MLAIPVIVKSAEGVVDERLEGMFRLPPELSDPPRLRQYASVERPGWSIGEFGFWTYAKRHDDGDLYIYPGLIVSDLSKPKRSIPGYKNSFTKKQVEDYADQLNSLISSYKRQVDDEMSLLIHDLRQISASIYHTAEEAKGYAVTANIPETIVRIDSIIAAQFMLRLRTDLLDYSANPALAQTSDHIAIYKKVDKVVRCFRSYAGTKDIALHLEGASFGHASGPDMFEIVPYIIIDNAIKYSPRNNDITISVSESQGRIVVKFSSVGPRIENDELEAIFERGYRGRNAIRSKAPGSGTGLFVARQLVEQFGGRIKASVSDNIYIIGDQNMSDIEFWLEVPLTRARSRY